MQADGSHVGARHRLAVLLLDMGRVEEAVALLEEAMKIAPQRGELQFLLAAMLDEQGRPTRRCSTTGWRAKQATTHRS